MTVQSIEAAYAARQVLAPPKKAIAPPDIAKICAGLPGRYKRIPTYFADLDQALRGGLQTGRLMVIGGPPGVTKTGFVLDRACEMARQGVTIKGTHHPIHVVIIACDEPRDGLLSRVGQMHGLSRDDLEDEDVTVSGPAWSHVESCLEEVPSLTIWDPREDEGATVESIVALHVAASAAAGARLVVILDSLQTGHFACDADTADKSPRERIDARMRVLRSVSIKHRAGVIVISEISRAGYGQGREADLASFKESSGIEFGVDVALLLAKVKGEERVIEVSIHKSRLGESDLRFRMERTTRCTFRSVEMPAPEDVEAMKLGNEEARVREMADALVIATIKAKAPPTTRDDLLNLLTGENRLKSRAISLLKTSGRLVGGGGKPFSIVPAQ